MRPLLIIGIVISLFLHFSNQDVPRLETDTIVTRQSALQKILPQKRIQKVLGLKAEMGKSDASIPALEQEIVDDSNDEIAQIDEDEDFNIPWKEIEDGWKAELRDYLLKNDPDRAEEIYSAYLAEKEVPVRGPALVGAVEENADDVIVDYSEDENDEEKRKERIQEILGDHYKNIKDLHREYVESIQHMNHSEVKFSIAL